MPTQDQELMTLDECLTWLKKPVDKGNREWLMRKARSREVPAIKIGDEWRFHAETILKECRFE
jgi:hypothetical protein